MDRSLTPHGREVWNQLTTHLISQKSDGLSGAPPTQVHAEQVVRVELEAAEQDLVQPFDEGGLEVPGTVLPLGGLLPGFSHFRRVLISRQLQREHKLTIPPEQNQTLRYIAEVTIPW